MEIRKLILEDFRRFEKQEIEFTSKTNLLLGPNKSGKTTILEAISLLSTANSFRAEKIEEMIRWGQPMANVQASLANKGKLQIILTPGEWQGKKVPKKKLSINGVEKKKRDFVGQLLTVIFRPEDIRIITGSPTRRRDFFDSVLVQTNWEYARSLGAYQKALRSRNKVLEGIRDRNSQKSDLLFWNQSLDKNGEIIFARREEFVNFVNNFWPEGLRFLYRESRFVPEKNLKKEIEMGMTLSGPHRDDFYLEKNAKDLAVFGSRSEQRLAGLNLKLVEREFIRMKKGEMPILLLDDIFSELDKESRQKVAGIIPQQQTFITAAEVGLINKEFLDKMKIIEL